MTEQEQLIAKYKASLPDKGKEFESWEKKIEELLKNGHKGRVR